jgi:hypothetical protein
MAVRRVQWPCQRRLESSAQNEVASPDGRQVAFLRDYTLWVRDTQTKAEPPLTTEICPA